MIFCDTSFLFAYFSREDAHHEQAVKIAKNLPKRGVFMPSTVFQELMTLLTYKVSSKAAINLSKLLLSPDSPIELMRVDEAYFEEIMNAFEQNSPHDFSFVDMSLILLSKKMEAKIYSFDADLNKALELS